ncbi:sensor domain-containing phosphodiesterase [Blastochloris sulfoviridis]|uniref:EAL domain-containing protein n=1 Tax=Blastochloris sulfoviridis TaxID=50712 RepID=A0A5M6I3E2_9HYPH|nr:EAL domain-containing protein [Blastochloris sulfoviridis]KAA5602724.1 EAL domain-containing protein [Blastochloris sulfoviridis]
MHSFRLPADETQRLDALRRYDVLDTPPEESFDRLVRLVTRLVGTTAAAIGFTDADRHWLKARIGISQQEFPRDISFCAQTILEDRPLVVEDAQDDQRFSTNPLVCGEPGVRFYAGVPIRTRDGFNIGVLCALDTRSDRGPLTNEQMASLRELAELVADELELRRTVKRLGCELTRRAEAEAARALSEQRLQDFLDTATDWLWETDEQHRFVFETSSGAERWGLSPALGRTRMERSGGDPSDPKWRAHLADLEARRPFRGFRFAIRAADGCLVYMSVSGKPVFDADGTFRGYRGTGQDVTARIEVESALRDMNARLSLLYTSGVIGVVTCEGDRMVEANDEFLRIIGYSRADVAAGIRWSSLRPADQTSRDAEVLAEMRATGRSRLYETECLTKAGGRVPVSISAVSVDRAQRLWMALVQDISERKAAEAQIRDLAFRDTLTGLLNRRAFNEELGRRLTSCDAHDAIGALLFIDLDHFKDVNDAIGHDAGDALLQEIARRLQHGVRRHDLVARLGGDEFAVVLSDIGCADDAAVKASRLLESCRQPVRHAGHLIHTSASIGVTMFPRDGMEPAQLLKNADVALYRSKSSGRRTVSFFNPAMMAETVARMELIAELRKAIEDQQFRLAYQPIIDLSGRRRLAGFEALVRWQHPERGVLGPGAFLDVATSAGLDGELCAFTIKVAARQMRAWLDQGFDPGYVAINLSATELRDSSVPARVVAALAENRLLPRHLEIEITENVVISQDSKIEANLEALHHLGVRIALDDFGTGYSSLAHLKRFPVDVLKIDQSFVRDMETDPEDAVIARTIVRLAHSLDLKVVAEGIETEGQLARLRRMGCDHGQGFLIARPALAEPTTAWLAARQRRGPNVA